MPATQDELEEQSSQGSFTPSERMDILSTAIGKPDYPGRVRGEARGIGVKKFFGQTSQAEPSRELIAKLREELREELLSELRGEMQFMFQSKMESDQRTTQESPTFPSTRGSYNPPVEPLGQPSATLEPISDP